MAALTIRWTRQAIADVDHLYAFIAANNPAAAWAVVKRIDRVITSLVATPHGASGSCGRVNRAGRCRHAYIVAYRVRGRAVELLGVIHTARLWPDSF